MLLTLFESLKVVLMDIVGILIMSAKMAALGLLKIKVFLNKSYDVKISAYHDHHVTQILHQHGKKVETKNQKVLVANSYVCSSYRGKVGRRGGG